LALREVATVELSVDVTAITVAHAVEGMRRPFMQPFGRNPVGQRLGRAAWTAFHAALIHGNGVDVATSHALVAAEERNQHTMLVARWTNGRISRVVNRAARKAADAS
jgi:hypothetical protein